MKKKLIIIILVTVVMAILGSFGIHVIITNDNFMRSEYENSIISTNTGNTNLSTFNFIPKHYNVVVSGLFQKKYTIEIHFRIDNNESNIEKLQASLFKIKLYNSNNTYHGNLDTSFTIGEDEEENIYFESGEIISTYLTTSTFNKEKIDLFNSKNIVVYYNSKAVAKVIR